MRKVLGFVQLVERSETCDESTNEKASDFTSPIFLVNKMDSASLETKAFGHKLSVSEDPLTVIQKEPHMSNLENPDNLSSQCSSNLCPIKGQYNQETGAWLNGKEKHRSRSAEFRRCRRIRAVESNITRETKQALIFKVGQARAF
ncbi:hypothetical protein GQ457_11G018210 [Hibiscus cannabinus]